MRSVRSTVVLVSTFWHCHPYILQHFNVLLSFLYRNSRMPYYVSIKAYNSRSSALLALYGRVGAIPTIRESSRIHDRLYQRVESLADTCTSIQKHPMSP